MKTIYVNKNSEINTISKAFDLIDGPTEIIISKGIYKEKLKLTHSDVIIRGESKDEVIITFDDYSKKKATDGLTYNTFRTYTFMINCDNVTLENLTISNTAGYGPKIGQAVALHVIGNNINLNNINLKSFQDTLFLGPLPENLIERYKGFLPNDERRIPEGYVSRINNSYIEGSIDFIFGCGEAYFNNCEFKSLLPNTYVFAPSHYQNDYFGFTINNCRFTSDLNSPSVYLARPWRDYGKVTIINSTYQNHILDLGFNKWDGTNRDKTARFSEYNSVYEDNHLPTRCLFSHELTCEEVKEYLSKF